MQRVYNLRKLASADGEPILREKSFEILLDLIEKKQPKSILEIGVNRGLSGIAMLLKSKNAKLSGIEIDEEKIKLAKENYKEFDLLDRAKIFQGDASEIIPILTGTYDFIFLDGPKGHYYEYLPHLLAVLNVGGVLFADNVLFRGYVGEDKQAPKRHNTIKHSMENFINAITTDKTLKTQIIDIEDGISITEKIL
ncbi:MAG: O-methyltransferase [Clostridiales bacterium]|nr:O-methyltransferase [Clostridiales bacterium]